ncbi:hypothetical protein TBR22_A51330 [Luteitalea sp. TBR-22]|uniref:PEP-CTERM sorting domain-containing protein n=1 Tax=Luteitalea sp. TBR-22 TaxID=2802971 RepID=UPI001AF93921|nr:PEP-CTERM sorting domain-containing protein [Luteitalea sp. TBR-22]BCS35898.1 hypothetical protein TBR22_A51330 [Luteitalea sp. TBR-22]
MTLFDGASPVFTATGSDVGPLVGFGHPGAGYVTVVAGQGERFTRVVLSSTDYPFETDNHAYVPAVPEPSALLLLAAGLGAWRRPRRPAAWRH